MDKDIEALDAELAALAAKRQALLQRAIAAEQLAGATEQEKDDGLLRVLGSAMQARLAAARSLGAQGWHGSDVSDGALLDRLEKNIAAADFVDAAILAGMLHVRSLLATSQPPQE